MTNKKVKILIILTIILLAIIRLITVESSPNKPTILSYKVNPSKQKLIFFWKDAQCNNYGSFLRLKEDIEKNKEELIFAVNGGMYNKKHEPNGLYIEDGVVLSSIDNVEDGYGNFYLQPNGVFYLSNNGKATITQTSHLKQYNNIKYATQSGPMLVINNKINTQFTKESKNKYIRNGVGILPNGDILFALSTKKVNFYKFARFFKETLIKSHKIL